MSQYPLGSSEQELERLRFQHEVWGGVTRAFLRRLGVREGWNVLDLGCGPGFVSLELSELVGARGSVVALDESARWTSRLRSEVGSRGLANVRVLERRIQDAELAPGSFDLVFARWVFSFLPGAAALAAQLARALAPGGLLAIEDYNHEGISLFPESAGMRAVVRATRALYARSGGDPWIAARLPGIFRGAGLEPVEYRTNVLAGGPDSGAFRWAGQFFPHFSAAMEEAGLLSSEERAGFLLEWAERERDPDAVFFSPIVVDAAARRPR